MSLITIQEKLKWYLPFTLAPTNQQPVAFEARVVTPRDNRQQPRAQTPKTPPMAALLQDTDDDRTDDVTVIDNNTNNTTHHDKNAHLYDNPIPSRVTERIPPKLDAGFRPVNHKGRNGARYIGKKVNFETIYKTTRPPRLQRQYDSMSKTVSRGYRPPFSPHRNDDDDSDSFQRYVKKRTKTFFISGFERTITESIIEKYISDKGLTVKNVSISLSRQQNVIIRVGIEDDGNADNILGEYFFPRGVICRPWRRHPFSNESGRSRRDVRQSTQTNSDHPADDINNHVYNRYDVIDVD